MDSEILQAILNQYGISMAITTIVIAFFVSTFVSGFIVWFQQRSQASFDTKIHVSKIQFDVEYEAYRTIWDSLVEVRNAVLSLRPFTDSVEKGKSKEDIRVERIRVFGLKYNGFYNLVEKNKPFYAPSVYDALSQIRKEMYSEAIDYEYDDSIAIDYEYDSIKRKEYWKNARENQEKILASIELANDAIRARINSITIIS